MTKKPKSADKNNLKTSGPKKPKAAKAAKPVKEVKAPKEPKAAKPPVRDIVSNPQDRELFHQHLPKIQAQKERMATMQADLRNMYKSAKAHGFDKTDFDIAVALSTPEKEAKVRAEIARKMQVAQWVDSDIGEKLDFFLDPVRIPAGDRAYKEGQTAAMHHGAAKPSYDPSTEQHREYMRGYHEVQAKQLRGGIGKAEPHVLDPDQQEEKVAVPPKQAEKSTSAGEPITSGMMMTRADFKLQKDLAEKAQARQAQEAADKQAAEKAAGAGDGGSMFHKKAASPS
jgi:uncharacterized protein (UPF0335 family)